MRSFVRSWQTRPLAQSSSTCSERFPVLRSTASSYTDGTERADYPQLVAQIRPSLAAILSITPETWSHTLTEAWGVGLPVLVTDLGASAERVRAQGGGWVVPAGDAAAALAELVRITEDSEEFSQRAAEAGRTSWDSTASMAAEYLELYRTVLQARSSVG